MLKVVIYFLIILHSLADPYRNSFEDLLSHVHIEEIIPDLQLKPVSPTLEPSWTPSILPTRDPSTLTLSSLLPTMDPLSSSSKKPSTEPTYSPSSRPTVEPSMLPSTTPSIKPTLIIKTFTAVLEISGINLETYRKSQSINAKTLRQSFFALIPGSASIYISSVTDLTSDILGIKNWINKSNGLLSAFTNTTRLINKETTGLIFASCEIGVIQTGLNGQEIERASAILAKSVESGEFTNMIHSIARVNHDKNMESVLVTNLQMTFPETIMSEDADKTNNSSFSIEEILLITGPLLVAAAVALVLFFNFYSCFENPPSYELGSKTEILPLVPTSMDEVVENIESLERE